MAINTPKEDLPLWLQEIMVARGIYPDINIGVSSDASPFVVPPRIRREYEDVWGGDGDDILMGSSGENDRLNDEGSSNIIETLKGFFSSNDTDPDFQAVLTDVANQGFVGPPERTDWVSTNDVQLGSNEGKYTYIGRNEIDKSDERLANLTDAEQVVYMDPGARWRGDRDFFSGVGNSFVGPSFVGDKISTFSPNYDGLVEMRGQDFYDSMSKTSGNSVLDKAANLFSGFGNFVDNSLSKLGGLFSGSFSNPFDFDYTPSISDPTSPMGLLGGAATALSDPHLSTSQKVGQALGGGLGAAASLVIPGAFPLSLFAAAMQQKGAHHDFNPSTDYNLNFDTRSGRTDWGSTTDGAGGVQYGSLNNENMIEDLAEKDPNFEIRLDGGKSGYITAENWVAANEGLKAGNAAFGFNLEDPFKGYTQTDYFAAAADAPGTTFQSFGGGTLGEALTEYGQTGTGAIMNRAGAMLGPNAGYNETRDLADKLAEDARQGGIATSGLFDVDTGTGAATVSDIASGLSSYTGVDIGTDTTGLDASTDDDRWDWDFDF